MMLPRIYFVYFSAFLAFQLYSLSIYSQNGGLSFAPDDDRMIVSNISAFTPNNFTVECWMYLDPAYSNGYKTIFHIGNTFASDFEIYTQNYSTIAIVFNRSNGAPTTFYIDQTGYPVGQWFLLTVSYSNTGGLNVYYDGVQAPQWGGAVAFPPLISTGSNIYIGTQPSNPWGQCCAPAILDEFRIWNKKLTLSEVQDHVNCELSGMENDLFAYYSFNQGVANGDNTGMITVSDDSGNGIVGTIFNFNLTGTSSNWVSGSPGISSTCAFVLGCTDSLACNYDPTATTDDGSCVITGASCNDFIACTYDDVYDANCECHGTPNDALCDDGVFCNGQEYCDIVNGCSVIPLNIDDGDPCTIDYCDETTGMVYHDLMNCDDGIACTYDYCNNGSCAHTPDDSLCDDGVFCNGQETCSVTLGCIAGVPPVVDDGDPCTLDFCDEVTNTIVHQPMNCDDGIECTYDYCDNGTCVSILDPFLCDDGNPCTTNTCNPFLGCTSTPVVDGTPCDDGNPTTVTECVAGACTVISIDMDLDGFDSTVDCNDNDPFIYPGAPEICNGIDDNCDGVIDDGLTLDTDNDGLTDCEETLVYFTDPNDKDSDSDGLTDGLEVNLSGTNPNLADTDGDGCTDDLEFSYACPDSVFNPCPSDFTGDGNINTEDLLFFLGTFGQICP